MFRRAERAKPAAIGDVAAQAGVSIATVSRVLNGVANKASPETVRRVRAAVKELGYRPMSVGRALRQQRSRLVAVLASNLGNPAMAAIAASVETALRDRGRVMVLCDTHDRPELQDEYLLEMRAQLAEAIVVLGAVRSRELRRAIAGAQPVIYVNRRCPYGSSHPFIGIDNRRAGAEAAEALVAAGCRRIGIIHGNPESSATADRLAGVKALLTARGLPVPADLVLTEPLADHLALGHSAMGRLLAQPGSPPDAVLCLSDLIAWGARRRAEAAGIDPMPHFFGFDGSPLNRWLAPWLRSVRIPYEAFGAAIADAIAGLRSGETVGERLLPYSLVSADTGASNLRSQVVLSEAKRFSS
jgi:LacI family transcriptional regulator